MERSLDSIATFDATKKVQEVFGDALFAVTELHTRWSVIAEVPYRKVNDPIRYREWYTNILRVPQ